MNPLALIAQTGVLPVIVIDSPDRAVPLGLALLDAGHRMLSPRWRR
jgi:2-keto-3-deoxy-6-phosphogluconate aldolase